MQKETLRYISDALISAGIPYDYEEFKAPIDELSRYWVGTYQESEPISEDGSEESAFTLTGYSKEDILILENDKNVIKEIFPTISGNSAILDNGSAIAIFYANAFPVPTGNEIIKKIQINLAVKEWRVEL